MLWLWKWTLKIPFIRVMNYWHGTIRVYYFCRQRSSGECQLDPNFRRTGNMRSVQTFCASKKEATVFGHKGSEERRVRASGWRYRPKDGFHKHVSTASLGGLYHRKKGGCSGPGPRGQNPGQPHFVLWWVVMPMNFLVQKWHHSLNRVYISPQQIENAQTNTCMEPLCRVSICQRTRWPFQCLKRNTTLRRF